MVPEGMLSVPVADMVNEVAGVPEADAEGTEKDDGMLSVGSSEPVGRLTVGRLIVGRLTVGRLTVGRLTVGRLSVGRLTVGRLSVGRVIVGTLYVGRLNVVGSVKEGIDSVMDTVPEVPDGG